MNVDALAKLAREREVQTSTATSSAPRPVILVAPKARSPQATSTTQPSLPLYGDVGATSASLASTSAGSLRGGGIRANTRSPAPNPQLQIPKSHAARAMYREANGVLPTDLHFSRTELRRHRKPVKTRMSGETGPRQFALEPDETFDMRRLLHNMTTGTQASSSIADPIARPASRGPGRPVTPRPRAS